MNPTSLQIFKACLVAFVGAAAFCSLSLCVQRGVTKEDQTSASGGLPIILNFGHIGALGYAFSMLGDIQFRGVVPLVISYVAAIAGVVYLATKYQKNQK